jgi:hypothetical protein
MKDTFSNIIIHIHDGKESCYRLHYPDIETNNLHRKFMDENGWSYTGKCLFNSGDGTLHIYERKQKKSLWKRFIDWIYKD